MKVVRVSFRTPGVFIQGQVELEMQVKPTGSRPEDWTAIENESRIKVLAESVSPSPEGTGSFVGSIETQSVEVPHVGESIKTYDLLMKDGETWEYQVLAKNCFNCMQAFPSRSVLSDSDFTVWISSGSINS